VGNERKGGIKDVTNCFGLSSPKSEVAIYFVGKVFMEDQEIWATIDLKCLFDQKSLF
jgi:hypothetical protein